MKFKLKLLKSCTLGDQELEAGVVIELEDQVEYDRLIAEGFGEKFAEPDPRDEELELLRAENLRQKNELAKKAGKPATPKSVVTVLHTNDKDPNKFKSFGEQLMAVFNVANNLGMDKRLQDVKAAAGMNEAVGSDGGFLVQTDFVSELLTRSYDAATLASRCRRIPLTSNANALTINGVDETSRKDGSRWGGVRAYWADEAEEKTASKPKFRKINLKLNKLIGLTYVTDELLQDAGALESFIQQAFSDEIAFKLDDAILRGTGVGMPLGILNSLAKVVVPKVVGQTADTIVFDNVSAMRSRLWARSRSNAVWLINQDAESQLERMTVVVRNAANTDNVGGSAIWMPAGGITGSPNDTLYARPVLPIEQADTLGEEGDLMLVDLSQYLLIDKGGIQSASSIHVKFITDETAFRFVYRVDGQPLWHSALTPYKGTTTVSPFVTLAARA
jgi:HK97 family phage major capsid protein